jgi:hypothetical protein
MFVRLFNLAPPPGGRGVVPRILDDRAETTADSPRNVKRDPLQAEATSPDFLSSAKPHRR